MCVVVGKCGSADGVAQNSAGNVVLLRCVRACVGRCQGLFLFHILSPVAFCYLPSFMSFSILDFSQV